MVDANLDEIQNLVSFTLKAASTANQKNTPEDVSELPSLIEPWILPVACTQLPRLDPEVKKARFDREHAEVDVLDVIRAFCHPRVIEIVSQILQDESNN